MSGTVNAITVGKGWSPDESIKLIQASSKMNSVQDKVDEVVRILIHCPQILEICPSLKEYKSSMRQIDPNVELPVPERVKQLDAILLEIQEGKSIKKNFKKLGKMFGEIDKIDPKNAALNVHSEWIQYLSRWFIFAKNPDNHGYLTNPSLHQLLYGLDDAPNEVTEINLKEQLESLKELQDLMTEAVLLGGNALLEHENFLSPLEKIFVSASAVFKRPTQFKDTFNPVGMGLAMSALAVEKSRKEGLKMALADKDEISKIIKGVEASELMAESLLNEKDPVKLLEISQSTVNGGALKSLPLTARFHVLKSLAESDQIYGEYFKRKTMKLAESIIKPPKEESKAEVKDTGPKDPCPIQ